MRRALSFAAVGIALAAVVPGARATDAISFALAVKVNASGWGFEPTIDTDSEGTLYVTAHKAAITHEDTRAASFIWYSRDAGASWNEMPSPFGVHDKFWSFEGDIAVDARDRVYFVDTYAADLWMSTWSKGPTWDRSGVAVTRSAFDDRPWLAAHGDGIVYLMSTDVLTYAPPLDALGAPPGTSAWAITPVLHRSLDGGVTWEMVRAFRGANFCGLAASPLDDVSLTVSCAGREYLTTHTSSDRGAHWTDHTVFDFETVPASMVTVAYDSAGNAYTTFVDGVATGNRVYVARGVGGTWSVQEVTPFTGSFREVWTTAGAPGEAGIAFYATPDVAPGSSSEWHVYGGVTADGLSDVPSWSIARADPRRVITGMFAPPDFLQCVIDPSGTLYVAFSIDNGPADPLHAAPPNFDHDIYVARQASGPNLG